MMKSRNESFSPLSLEDAIAHYKKAYPGRWVLVSQDENGPKLLGHCVDRDDAMNMYYEFQELYGGVIHACDPGRERPIRRSEGIARGRVVRGRGASNLRVRDVLDRFEA